MTGRGRPSRLRQHVGAVVEFIRAEAVAGRGCPTNQAIAGFLGLSGETRVKEVLLEATAIGLIVIERGPNWRVIGAGDGSWRTGVTAVRPPPEHAGAQMWSAEKDRELTALWNEGLPTSQIGYRLGVSKNAAIGRARRLRLAARPSPIGQRPNGAPPREPKRKPGRPNRTEAQRAARIAARRAVPPANPIPAAQVAPSGDPAPVRPTGLLDVSSLLDLPRPVIPAGGSSAGRCCRWPMWGDKERPTNRYCDAPVSWRRDGTPRAYCAEHAARAFTDRAERDPDHVVTRSTFAWGGVRA